MERLQSLLETLISQHQTLVDSKADWGRECYILGKIAGVRAAIMLIQEPNSVIPSELL